jgi:hypothetical protein
MYGTWFIIRLIIGFTRPINVFTFGLIIPLALLAVILIFDSIFLSHWVKEIKRHDGRVEKHTEALLVVKSNTKRGIYIPISFSVSILCLFDLDLYWNYSISFNGVGLKRI